MTRCENCIYSKMCYWIALFDEKTPCEHFLSTADVVPRAEVEKIFEEIEKKIKALLTLHLEELNKEYVKDTPLYDRHSGILYALQCMEDFIAELKTRLGPECYKL